MFRKNVLIPCRGQNSKPKLFVLYYCIALFSFPFSLSHSSLYALLPLSPVNTIPCQFTLSSNSDHHFKCQKKSFQLFRKYSTLKKEAAYFSETHTCLPMNVHAVTCQKTLAVAAFSGLFNDTISAQLELRESRMTWTEIVLSSGVIVWLLAEV
jgi:hypothetical protein